MSEELIVYHCSPTLAGLKTGNLFRCSYRSEKELLNEVRDLNKRLVKKGLRILPLKMQDHFALIYVYRPSRLKEDISHKEAAEILEKYGYICNMPDQCVKLLSDKLKNQEQFPHEIGLFLGYPAEDVKGFIENGAKGCKCTGCWKVYGDEEKAKTLFATYKRCTEDYLRYFRQGNIIEQLTVAV